MNLTRGLIALFLVASVAPGDSCFAQSGRTGSPGPSQQRLTCLVMGYDSLICYNDDNLRGANRGKLSDTIFTGDLLQQAKANGNFLTLKPCDGTDMGPNLQELINLATNHGIGFAIDSTNAAEESAFRTATPATVKSMLRSPLQAPEPVQMSLPSDPKDRVDSANPAFRMPLASQLVIEISGNTDPFVYTGDDRRGGKLYATADLKALLVSKSADPDFSVIIKTAKDAAYKQIVTVLDLIKQANVEHYALVEP